MSCSRERVRTSSGLSVTIAAPTASWRTKSADHARQVDGLAKVAVTAGDGEDRSRREDAWSGDHSLVDGALECERRSADVADGRESAHQRGRGFGPREKGEVAEVRGHQHGGRRPHQHRMPMVVDQPRHERASGAVDQHGVGSAIGRDRRRGDPLDDLPLTSTLSRPGQRPLLPSNTRTFWNSVTGRRCRVPARCTRPHAARRTASRQSPTGAR